MSRKVAVRSNRPKQQSRLLGSLRVRALSPTQIVELALPGYVALDVVARNAATEHTFHLLAQYAVFIDLLCQAGLMGAERDRALRFGQALEAFHARARASHQWKMTEDELSTSRAALALHMGQLDAASLPQIIAAHEQTVAFLASAPTAPSGYEMAA
jgi:hypothetical protein